MTYLTYLTYLTYMTNLKDLIPHIEALIFASDKPLASMEITELINQAFGFMEDKIMPEQVDAAIEGIVEKYNSDSDSNRDYPFEVRQSGGGWQFLTKKEYHKTVAQLNGEKFLKRLSAAALETLAIVAYKQPVTKGEIESIRGVSSDYAVQKLLEKELIVITGRNEKLPGHPLVYATSKNFMDYFGINSAEDLPKIKEVLASQIVEPTAIRHTNFEQSEIIVKDEDSETERREENYLNGYKIEMQDAEEPVMETETSEEANEEFIADELFIEGDETKEETEKPQDEDSSGGNETSSGNENDKEEKPKE